MRNWFGLGAVASMLALVGLAAPARAQKVQDEVVTATFSKAPLLPLKPTYATYSVEYDLGNQMMNAPSPPSLRGLTFQRTGGDLLLRFTTKGVYVANRRLLESTSNNVYSCSYQLTYGGEFGYELRDAKTDQVVASRHRDGGSARTQNFRNLYDLNGYVDNAFVGERTRQELANQLRLADFALNPHQYQTQLTLHTVEGDAPAYAAINQATADLKALLTVGATPDPARLAALAAAWQQPLARVDWNDKKSEINKKVAGALLENLCALALLSNDYVGMARYAAAHTEHHIGFFNSDVGFKADMSYSGTALTPPTNILLGRDMNRSLSVNYGDLAADMQPLQ